MLQWREKKLTEEGEESCAVHDGSQAVLTLHEQFAEFPRIRSVEAAHHVNAVRIRRRHFASQVAV